MAEATTQQIVDSVPRFVLPKEFSNEPKPETKVETPAAPPTEAKPATEAVATPPDTEVEDTEVTGEETTGKDPEKPSTRRFERRIDRATRKAAEAQARSEVLERELQEYKSKATEPVPSAGEPKMEDFTDIKEYAKAYANFEKANAIKDYEANLSKTAQEKRVKQLVTDWDNKVKEADAKYDDFDEVVGEIKPTTPWGAALMMSENGPDVAHHLGKNLKEFRRIAALDPPQQFLAIGRLSATLAAQEEAPKKPSKAPAPINPVQGNAQVATGEYTDGMSPGDYMKSGLAKRLSGRR